MKKVLLKFIPLFSLASLVPSLVFAQYQTGWCGAPIGVADFLCRVHSILSFVLPVLIALGVVYLVFGIVQYFIYSDEDAKTKGRDRIVFGIIGLAVIISVWGLVYMLTRTFGTVDSAPDFNTLNELLP